MRPSDLQTPSLIPHHAREALGEEGLEERFGLGVPGDHVGVVLVELGEAQVVGGHERVEPALEEQARAEGVRGVEGEVAVEPRATGKLRQQLSGNPVTRWLAGLNGRPAHDEPPVRVPA